MKAQKQSSEAMSRRRFFGVAGGVAGGALALTTPATQSVAAAPRRQATGAASDFHKLNDFVREARKRFDVPGVAIGAIYENQQFAAGHGVTNVNAPFPVDENTLFQAGSITKTYTGTLMMRLVELGKVDLNAPVRNYLPELKLKDGSVAERVTVLQTLNHTAGWFGEYFGANASPLQPALWPNRGDDALAKYVADMAYLPQLAPPGMMFSYNNAATILAGRIIEAVTGMTYEAALTSLLLKPLGMNRTFLFPDEAIPYAVAAGHNTDAETPEREPRPRVNPIWAAPRCVNPAGGLILSMTEQLKYARFHLGDGRASDGQQLLSPARLRQMRTATGPGFPVSITGNAEVYGIGVNWMLERMGGVQIVTHNGAWVGQESLLVLAPQRGFALAVLTNHNPQGHKLYYEVSAWALKEFLGLSAAVPPPVRRTQAQLSEYVGFYGVEVNVPPGNGFIFTGPGAEVSQVEADGGGLKVTLWRGPSLKHPLSAFTQEGPATHVSFFRDDAFLYTAGGATGPGGDFVRDGQKRIGWLRWGGQIQPRLPGAFGK